MAFQPLNASPDTLSQNDTVNITRAFADQPDLAAGIFQALSEFPILSNLQRQHQLADHCASILTERGDSPHLIKLFSGIAVYVLELQNQAVGNNGDYDPAAKKRKLDMEVSSRVGTGTAPTTGRPGPDDNSSINAEWSSTSFDAISFSVPQRKKLVLDISSKQAEGIRAKNPDTESVEFGIPWKEAGWSCPPTFVPDRRTTSPLPLNVY